MTEIINPWSSMGESSQRRVDFEMSHNLFWITDIQGRYGFCIQAEHKKVYLDEDIKLKGISIIKRVSKNNFDELFLILNKSEDWQIFLALCDDLISVTKRFNTNEKMLSAIDIRLKRWQQLLRQDIKQNFSLQKQMGLFSELLCLRDVVSREYGIDQAIISWVGPDFDKQDFLMDNIVLEVKSYRTSAGELVQISSLQQLQSVKPLYLLTYALSNSENGFSVKDIVGSIKELITHSPQWIIDLFEEKLIGYGYIPEINKEPLYKFILDRQKTFIVSETFPKIIPGNVNSQIHSVKYTIDLSQCQEFEVQLKSFLEEEMNNDKS